MKYVVEYRWRPVRRVIEAESRDEALDRAAEYEQYEAAVRDLDEAHINAWPAKVEEE
jgi:hypothetical protein